MYDGLFLAGCFEHHGMTPEPPPEPPACIASAPVLVAPAGPGCASLELTVQDLPHAPLRRCALGAWAEERPVQPVYVANGADTPIEVRVHHVSVDCGLGTRERCGGAADSTPDGCACGATTFGPYELWERPSVEMRFVIEGEGSTIFVGGDRVTYRIDACRLPGPSDPFPIPTECATVRDTGGFDHVECDGLEGFGGAVAGDSERRACYCAPRCVTSADCPRTGPGEVEPFCDEHGICRLPCDGEGACPAGTECVRILGLEGRFDRPICAAVR